MTCLSQVFDYTRGDCRLFSDRSSKMKQIYLSSIRATKLIETNLTSKLICASQCVSIDQGYYMTVDTKNNMCTCYGQGLNSYNTTKLDVYVLEMTRTEVKQR